MAKYKRDNLRGGRQPCARGAIAMLKTRTDEMYSNNHSLPFDRLSFSLFDFCNFRVSVTSLKRR